MKSGKLIHHLGRREKDEWYTPADLLDAAQEVLGTIDLDPASSEIANLTVQAREYYTIEQNGLTQPWHGNVWLNPPYSQPVCSQFCHKAAELYETGEIRQAIVLINNATETGYFQALLDVAAAVCFPSRRVKFLDPAGHPSNRSLQGQAIIFLGPEASRFQSAFRRFGMVLTVPTAPALQMKEAI